MIGAAMARRVEPEWLDELPAEDPRARHSRRDLARVNALMGNAGIVAAALRRAFPQGAGRIAEIGAGDGAFALRLARRLPRPPRPASFVLLDRQPSLAPDTASRLAARGWNAGEARADVFDWLRRASTPRFDAIVANLFLHHFEGERLAELLALIAEKCTFLVACEPRRSGIALAGSGLLGLLGCNAVTRHDAVASVRAGFRDGELTALWPRDRSCTLEEGPRGPFSHCLLAWDECATTR